MGLNLTKDGGLCKSLFAGFAMSELTALRKYMSFPVSFCNTAKAALAIIHCLVG